MQVDPEKIMLWTARVIAAAIMVQTLYFKFSGAPESIYIFEAIGIEPWGRITVGILELVASILLVIPSLSWIGAAMGVALMAGAISFHMTILGVEVQGDGGYLFFLALVAAGCSLFVLWSSRETIRAFIRTI